MNWNNFSETSIAAQQAKVPHVMLASHMVSIQVLAALLWIQLPADMSGKAAADGTSPPAPAPSGT